MEIQERIVVESFKLFINNGIRSVTMDDIAKHLGISKKTIYENFRDKDDLLKNCILYHKELQERNINLVITTSKNVLDTIYKVMFETVSNMQKVHASFFSDLEKYHYKLCKTFIPQDDKEKKLMLESLLSRGVAEGIFRESTNIKIAATILNYQLKGISNKDVFPPEEFKSTVVIRTIIENFTRGIATPKGIEIIEQIIEQKEKEI
ncbi:MAG: TetR/AcrR family transcriptional regulator [Bacteroidales bacterium]|nr:TetR/AcrR family transcriptional regulator [Bacteroidales bacterium]